MGNVTQIYSIVNASVSDFLGGQAPRATDTTSFADLGRTLGEINTESDPYHGYDSFFGALVSRIAKTEVFTRLYEKTTGRRVLTDLINFGAFCQRIYVDVPDAVTSPAWAVSNGENPPTIASYSPYGVTATATVTSIIYGKRGTWSLELKLPTVQIKEAFLNETAMAAFIDGIYIQVASKLAVQLEELENLAVSTAIAECIENGKATNLLQVYNAGATTQVSLTTENCMKSLDFLALANKTIDNMRGYMKKMSTKYNAAGYKTFTSDDNMICEVLTDFASSSKFYLESNTYHDELVKMKGYVEVPFWQGPGDDGLPSFEDISAINILNKDIKSNPDTGAAVAVKQTGIICFLRDVDLVKAYFGDRNTWEIVNPRERTITHGEHADIGYAVDPHANGWVFYIEDET